MKRRKLHLPCRIFEPLQLSSKEDWWRKPRSSQRNKHAYSFLAVEPSEEPLPDCTEIDSDEPLMAHPQTFRKDLVFGPQDSRKTGDCRLIKPAAFPIILCKIMPSDAFVRFVKFPKNKSETVILFFTGRKTQQITRTCNSIGKATDPVQMYGITSRKPDATIHANSTGELCVKTMTKRGAHVLISECKENQIDGRRTKKMFPHKVTDETISEVSKKERIRGRSVTRRQWHETPTYFSRCQQLLWKNLAIVTLVKFSWS